MNVPSLNQAIGRVDQAAAARLRRYRAAHPGMPCPSVRFALDDANRTIDACEAGQTTEPEAVRTLELIAAALGNKLDPAIPTPLHGAERRARGDGVG